MIPIWKDTYVTLGSADSYYFRISTGGSIIYQGKAYKKPGASSVSIRINDICSDYLYQSLPDLTVSSGSYKFVAQSDIQVTFSVTYSTDGTTWSIYGNVEMSYDWTYDSGFNWDSLHIANPITLKIDGGATFLYTTQGAVNGIWIGKYNKAGEWLGQDTISTSGNPGTLVIKSSYFSNLGKVMIGNNVGTEAITYEIVDNCSGWAAVYVNKRGAWDTLLLEGNENESIAAKRYTKAVEVSDNSVITARETEQYAEELTTTYTLRTGWLTDEESGRMDNLIHSGNVYLRTPLGEMLPVIVATDTCEVKTFHNQGNAMVNYEITFTLAKNRIRK